MVGETDVVRREDDGYRRGVVLGLTIAEVTILLLFCLLLTVVLLLDTKQKRIAVLEEAAGGAVYVVSPPIVDQLEEKFGAVRSSDQIDDYFQRLIASASRVDVVDVALKESGLSEEPANYATAVTQLLDVTKAARQAVATSGQSSKTFDDIKQGMARIQGAVTQLVDAGTFRDSGKPNFEVVKTVMAGNLCALQFATDRQLEECERKVIEIVGGKGLEFQSCWWDKSTVPWRTKNIFEVALTDDGYVVRALDPGVQEYRLQKASELGLERLPLETTVNEASFLAQTAALMRWSEEHMCRFYVRVYDETGPTSKETYKTRREALERHFYPENTRRRFAFAGGQ